MAFMAIALHPGHSCKWPLCPYKNLSSFGGVIVTGGTRMDSQYNKTDVYYIDSLHFKHPRLEYDQLDSLYSLQIKTN